MKLVNTDNGNCRVYYKGGDHLLCFQKSVGNQFELLVCTRDGEPSFALQLNHRLLDKLPSDGSATTREFNAWVALQPEESLSVSAQGKKPVDQSPSP